MSVEQIDKTERPLEGLDLQQVLNSYNEGAAQLNTARKELIARSDALLAESPLGPLMQRVDGNSQAKIIMTRRSIPGLGDGDPKPLATELIHGQNPEDQKVKHPGVTYHFMAKWDLPAINAALEGAKLAGLVVSPELLTFSYGGATEDWVDTFEVTVPFELMVKDRVAEDPSATVAVEAGQTGVAAAITQLQLPEDREPKAGC